MQLLTPAQVAAIPEAQRRWPWYAYASGYMESFGECVFQQPQDYNFLHRILGLLRTEDVTLVQDYTNSIQVTLDQFQEAGALFIAAVTPMITTVLHTYNIGGLEVQQVAMRDVNTPRGLNAVCNDFRLFRNTMRTFETKACIYKITQRMVIFYIGGDIPLNFAAYRSWNLPDRDWPFSLAPFANNFPLHPPRFGNPLALLSVLCNLPSEWGVVDGEAQFQFHSDMQVQGPAIDRIWAAVYGTDENANAKASVNPYEYVAYGALAMNIIAQAFPPPLQPAGQPQFQYRAYAANASKDMSYQVIAHPRPPVWDAAHRFFEPCTVMTFDWQTYT
ncbi:hypothetical protein TKK_0003890 [Trichogramma kaykai]